MKADRDYVARNFKNGQQLLFNTEFLEGIFQKYKELHCEFCNKKLELIYWYENTGRNQKMATADHFFPKSLNKELLAFNHKNMVVACSSCNTNKDNKIIPIDDIKYPYPNTIDNLKQVKNTYNENLKS